MRIVIDIDEDYVKIINKNGASNYPEEVIENGIKLPKGHGRLIDADVLLKRISEKAKTPSLSEDTVNGLCGATAIIYDMLNESGQEK